MNNKMFNGGKLANQILLTTRQKTRLRNASPLTKVAVPLVKKYSITIRNDGRNRCRNWKKIHRSRITTLIISNEEINNIIKIVKTLEDSDILLKSVTKTIEKKIKK